MRAIKYHCNRNFVEKVCMSVSMSVYRTGGQANNLLGMEDVFCDAKKTTPVL